MNGRETIVDRFRAADPAPARDALAAEELAHITSLLEERRGRMTTDVRTPKAEPLQRKTWRPAFAFGLGVIAVLIIVGIGLLLWVGGPAEDVVAPTETSTHDETAPTGAPTTAAPEPSETATPTQVTALPTMANGLITLTEGGVGSDVSAALDQSGRLLVAYYSPDEDEVRVLRCADPGCVRAPDVFTMGALPSVTVENEELEPGFIEMALQPNGAPVVVILDPATVRPTMYACVDPECAEVVSGTVHSQASIDSYDLGVATDGLPLLAFYRHGESSAWLELAVCGDLVCSAEHRQVVTLDEGIEDHGDLEIVTLPDGRVIVAYDTIGPATEARVAVCSEAACPDGPTLLRFPGAVGARVTLAADHYVVWYRSGVAYVPEGDALTNEAILETWDLAATRCTADGCGDPVTIDAPATLLWAWRDDARMVSLADGTTIAAAMYFSSELCALPVEFMSVDLASGQVGDPAVVYYLGGSAFDMVTDGERVVGAMGTESDTLQAAEIPLTGASATSAPPVCEN